MGEFTEEEIARTERFVRRVLSYHASKEIGASACRDVAIKVLRASRLRTFRKLSKRKTQQ